MTTRVLRSLALFCAVLAGGAVADQVDQPDLSAKPKPISPNETIPEYLGKYGIPVEEHWATTEDGYILEIFRLPRPNAPVLLVQHGLLCSAWARPLRAVDPERRVPRLRLRTGGEPQAVRAADPPRPTT